MHYFLLIYFNNKPIHVSSKIAAHHQEDQHCIYSEWYSHALNDYTTRCLYRVDPPDDEQQACSKHVEAYYWNRLIENSAFVGSYNTDISQCTVNRTLNLKVTRLATWSENAYFFHAELQSYFARNMTFAHSFRYSATNTFLHKLPDIHRRVLFCINSLPFIRSQQCCFPFHFDSWLWQYCRL